MSKIEKVDIIAGCLVIGALCYHSYCDYVEMTDRVIEQGQKHVEILNDYTDAVNKYLDDTYEKELEYNSMKNEYF